MFPSTILKLLILVAACSIALSRNAQATDPFRMAFPRDVLKNVAPSDVKIAANILLKDLIENQGYKSEVSVLETHDEMIAAMLDNQFDCVAIFPQQYLKHRDTYPLSPQIISSYGDKSSKQSLLLLTRADESIETMKNPNVIIQSGMGDIVNQWLATEFSEPSLFKQSSLVPNVSKAILPVFFKKADIAVCQENSYNVITELNPQIKSRLKIARKSEPLSNVTICFCNRFKEKKPGSLKRAGLALQDTKDGRVLLNIFGVERFLPAENEDYTSILDIIQFNKKVESEPNTNTKTEHEN